MTNRIISTIFFLAISLTSFAQTTILNPETEEPVSYATISFGNGNGIFADDDGQFIFTKKLYSDIDTLYISALGHKELKVPTINLPKKIYLESQIGQLQEVIIKTKPTGKFKIEKIKSVVHDDYFKCWLPTIESEIAVFFPNKNNKTTQIETLYFPIKTEAKSWRKRNSTSHAKKTFSTLFRVHFYENNNGFPGAPLSYDKVVFIATQEHEKQFELDITKHDIFIPKNGIFISLQVLGYTDKNEKLLPNKKYQEVKTKRGIVKVSTTFRPLLPFTNEIYEKRTFVKRIFLNGNNWLLYDKKNIKRSKLLLSDLNNYGIGLKMRVYKK